MDKKTTFWNSFLLGFLLGAASLYFFGTKKGREKIKEFLELLEKEEEIIKFLEETIEELDKNSSVTLNKILQKLDLNSKF